MEVGGIHLTIVQASYPQVAVTYCLCLRVLLCFNRQFAMNIPIIYFDNNISKNNTNKTLVVVALSHLPN